MTSPFRSFQLLLRLKVHHIYVWVWRIQRALKFVVPSVKCSALEEQTCHFFPQLISCWLQDCTQPQWHRKCNLTWSLECGDTQIFSGQHSYQTIHSLLIYVVHFHFQGKDTLSQEESTPKSHEVRIQTSKSWADRHMTLFRSRYIGKLHAPPPKSTVIERKQGNQSNPLPFTNGKEGTCPNVTGAQQFWNPRAKAVRRPNTGCGKGTPTCSDSTPRKGWSSASLILTSASEDVFSLPLSWHIWSGHWGLWCSEELTGFPTCLLPIGIWRPKS